ncbi:carbon starvation induced protein, partial [Klebsiella pneumoniae]
MNITLTLQRGTILTNALTAGKPTPPTVAQQNPGFSFPPPAQPPPLPA